MSIKIICDGCHWDIGHKGSFYCEECLKKEANKEYEKGVEDGLEASKKENDQMDGK